MNDKSLRILVVDFTSAPRADKPIVCSQAVRMGRRLALEELLYLADFPAFERLLTHAGPWVAGMDFPFGQPRRLIENLDWPRGWEEYVALAEGLGQSAWKLSWSATAPHGRPAIDSTCVEPTGWPAPAAR